jgi:hypothetical protein
VQGLALALLLIGVASASMALHKPATSVLVSVVSIAVIAVRAAWQVTRAAAALDWAVAHVTTAGGFLALPVSTAAAPRVTGSAETTLSRG